MTPTTEPQRNRATITRTSDGWVVMCSCGYLCPGWPTSALALADQNAHIRRAHFAADDTE